MSRGTDNISLGGTEKTVDILIEGTSVEAASDINDNAILEEKDSESKGDNNYYQEFNDLFETPNMVPESQGPVNLRRSYRKSTMPKRFSDFKLDNKVKYKNGTWVITDLPIGRKPIGSKWVFKLKYKSSGDVERFMAKLVAKGFNQNEGIYYEETFSSVVKIVTVRCILTLAVHNGWPVFQLDINNAFLYGDLVEDVYMTLPDGYFSKDDTRVDEINNFKIFLSSKFMIKDLGKLRYFLGIKVLESKGNMYLTQRKYFLELLAEFGMHAYKPCGTPIESKEGMLKSSKDISYVVHVLSQFMHAPLQFHLKLAFRVLRYLKNALGKRISFNKGNDLNLKVYVDSDWPKCKVTRKSVTGYAVFMGESLVSWKSKKQSMLSKSLADAEYKAMNSVTCEVIWILKILAELIIDTSLPVPLHCDNSYARFGLRGNIENDKPKPDVRTKNENEGLKLCLLKD
ncbi:ribonuclease H-like domain-containing protein [Tanacetum coccineum]